MESTFMFFRFETDKKLQSSNYQKIFQILSTKGNIKKNGLFLKNNANVFFIFVEIFDFSTKHICSFVFENFSDFRISSQLFQSEDEVNNFIQKMNPFDNNNLFQNNSLINHGFISHPSSSFQPPKNYEIIKEKTYNRNYLSQNSVSKNLNSTEKISSELKNTLNLEKSPLKIFHEINFKQNFTVDFFFKNSVFDQIWAKLTYKIFTSKIIVVPIEQINFITSKMLAQIFGCFGNVAKTMIDCDKNFAFIKLKSLNDTRTCIINLNSQKVLNFSLKVGILPDCYRSAFKTHVRENYAKFLIYQENKINFRFVLNSKIKLNPISEILHFTNTPKAFTLELLRLLIMQFCLPVSIEVVKKSSFNKKMCLVEFSSKGEAFYVLGELHNCQIDEKLLKVSFSQRNSKKN